MFLMRHGQDEDNASRIMNGRRDTDLTDIGKRNTKEAAKILKDRNIQIIYSSPLKRALKTAEIMAGELGGKIIIDECLVERDYGVLTGKPEADILKYAKEFIADNETKYFLEADGAENLEDVYRRAQSFLQDVEEGNLDKNVLIVSHENTLKMLIAAFYQLSIEEALKRSFIKNAEIIELKRGG